MNEKKCNIYFNESYLCSNQGTMNYLSYMNLEINLNSLKSQNWLVCVCVLIFTLEMTWNNLQ